MKYHKSRFYLIAALAMLLLLLTGCADKTIVASPTPDTGNTAVSPTPDGGSDATPASSGGIPDISTFSYSDDIDENGLWEGVTALDFVELYDYGSFTIPSDTHTVTDEQVRSTMDSLAANYPVTDRAVVDGDTVNIDYVGSVDGVPFDGGNTNGQGTAVTIGVTSYIDDFLEQLIGHTPGDTFDVNVTFPEDYGVDELNGKDAVFVTTVNAITQKADDTLTDAFVVKNLGGDYGWKTVAEMRDGVIEELRKSAIYGYIQDYLSHEVVVKSVPEKLVEYQKKVMLTYYQDYADNYGVPLEECLTSYVGVASIDDLIADTAEDTVTSAKYGLVMQAVAEDLKISVSDDDVASYFRDEMKVDDYSGFVDDYGMPYIKQVVLNQRVLKYLADNAVLE
jgi:trigger factor